MGVGRDTARNWVRAYRRDGLLWLTGVRKNQSYPFEVRLAAVKAVLEDGGSHLEVSERFGFSTRTLLATWIRAYRDHGEDGLRIKKRGRPAARSRPETDSEKIARLEMENAALKKLAALVAQERRSGRK